MDSMVQPMITSIVEMILWMAIFKGAGATEIGGFTQNFYLAYAVWSTFIARITVNWMYEFRMIEEIDSGTINSLLTRPLTFYEYYLSQLLGYKAVTTALSLVFPMVILVSFQLPTHWERLPAALFLIFYYLIFVFGMSFCIASLAFFFNKVHSLTVTKNLALWLFTGELFPLDLMPPAWQKFFLSLPFSSGVYVPVGYLTGRIDFSAWLRGVATTTVGLIVVSVVGWFLWRRGMKVYAGTGA
ncbi:MAG: ABC transporter permease [Bdellovibrionales bacterium]